MCLSVVGGRGVGVGCRESSRSCGIEVLGMRLVVCGGSMIKLVVCGGSWSVLVVCGGCMRSNCGMVVGSGCLKR